jgi:hypothetical protein
MKGFRFRLSTILIVVAVVAIAVAWWVDHHRQATASEQLAAEIRQMRNRIYQYHVIERPTAERARIRALHERVEELEARLGEYE